MSQNQDLGAMGEPNMQMKRTGIYRIYGLALFAGVSLASSAFAATINVPADQATIQNAINAASPGDTILVAPGTYNESLNIATAELTILSTAGRNATTIQDSPGAGNPIVRISAPGTTLGGPNQGFLIRHLNAGPTTVIYVDSDMIGFPGEDNAPPTSINGNRIAANQGSSGIYSDAALAEITFNLEGNVFAKTGGAYSFNSAMYFDSSNPGSVTNAAFYTANLNILSNVVNDFNSRAVYFNNSAYSSDIVIDNNTFNAAGAAGYGFYCSDYLYDASNMWFTSNTVNGGDQGFYFNQVENGSTLHVDNNTFDGFASYGVYVFYLYYGSDLTIDGNTIIGDGAADYGIYTYYFDEGCTASISRNTISDVDYAGIYHEYTYYSIVDILENTIEGNSANYGMFLYYCSATLLNVLSNNVSGYDDYGLYVDDYFENGGQYRFNGNTFTGDGTGSGINFDDYFEYGPYVEINNNTISQFDVYGIKVNEVYEGGVCKMNGNVITAAPNTATATGIYWEYIEGGGGTGEVVGNTIDMNGSALDGLYFYKLDYGADLLVDSNNVTGFKQNGLYFDDYIEYGATCVITNNNFFGHVGAGADSGVNISDYVQYGSHIVISNNDIRDYMDEGVYLDYVYEGATAHIDGNTLSARTNATSGYGVYIDDVEYGSDAWIRNNEIDVNNGANDAIYLYHIGFGSNAVVTGNTCLNYQDAGFFMDDIVEYTGSLVVNDNVFMAAAGTPSTYGVYLDDYVEYGSYFECVGNAISNFTDYGVGTTYIYYGSDIVCDDNVITGHADGADYGIYIADEIEYGAFFSSISGNTITNIKDDGSDRAGIYIYELYEGAFVDVRKNDVTAHPDGAAYGIMVEYTEYGSVFDFALNTIAGFTKAGFEFDSDISYGAIVTLRNNDILGAAVGILFKDYFDYGAEVKIRNNNIDGFTEYGVRFDNYINASLVDIYENWFTGGVSTARGVRTFAELNEGTVLNIDDNCFRDVSDGVVLFDIVETAIAALRGNDFSGVSGAAIISENADADHVVDAILNFIAGAGVAGNVSVAPELASAPDLDGDGVPNCDDLCPGTAPGVEVDENGCPLPPPPMDDNMNDNMGGNGNDNGGDNGNDNGGPAPQPNPEMCGCGNGGMMLMPLAAVGFAGMRRRVRKSRKSA